LEIGDQSLIRDSLSNLGNYYLRSNRYVDALNHFQRALVMDREMGDVYGEEIDTCNAGTALRLQGQANKAIEFHQKALDSARAMGDEHGKGNALSNLGSDHMALGDLDLAEKYFMHHLEIVSRIGDLQGKADALWNKALLDYQRNNHEHAREESKAALMLYRQVNSPEVAKVEKVIKSWD